MDSRVRQNCPEKQSLMLIENNTNSLILAQGIFTPGGRNLRVIYNNIYVLVNIKSGLFYYLFSTLYSIQ